MYQVKPSYYSLSNKFVNIWTKYILEKNINSNVGSFHKMIDIGCGSGENGVFMKNFFNCEKLLGLERNSNFVKYANDTNSNGSTSFEQLNYHDYDQLLDYFLMNKEVDIVVSTFCLHLIEDLEKYLKFLSTIPTNIKAEHCHIVSGKLNDDFIEMLEVTTGNEIWGKYFDDNKRSKLKFQMNKFSEAYFNEVLVNCKFNVKAVQEVSIDYLSGNLTEDCNLLRLFHPYVDLVPDHLQSEFLYDSAIHYREQLMPINGQIKWQTKVYLMYFN